MSRKDISASATSTFRTWASDFPPLPPAAARIWEEVRSAEPNARRVAGIVAQDPVMTAQLLRMANSVATAQTQEVTSTEQAILLMGYDCVLALAIRETLPVGQQLPLGGYDLEALTRHSVATGLFAGVVARITGRVDSAEAVTMGVMHDIGKLVMNTADPALVRRLLDSKTSVPEESPLRKEERLFGANHAIIGALLASEWHLPRLLVNALEFHHYPTTPELDGLGNRDRGLTATVFVANQLAKLAGFSGNDEDVDLLPQQVVDSLELPGSYEAIAHEVLPEVLVRLKAFGYSPKT
jgi:HD-like signal output (HDOD) protein